MVRELDRSNSGRLFPVGCIFLASAFAACLHQERGEVKAIYGEDDRQSVAAMGEPVVALSRSVATVVGKTTAKHVDAGWRVDTSYGQRVADTFGKPLCAGERFAEEPSVGSCTAFLVADDVVATAAHCVVNIDQCSDILFYFGYDQETRPVVIPDADAFSCRAILRRDFSADVALVLLDRKPGLKPLPLLEDDKLADLQSVFAIGHPMGLPAKHAGPAGITGKAQDLTAFRALLDLYMGNSGSPIFDSESGSVAGLLRKGAQDFTVDGSGCLHSSVCDHSQCLGELASSSKELRKLLASVALGEDAGDTSFVADFAGDKDRVVSQWAEVDFDFELRDGTLSLTQDNARVKLLRRAPPKIRVELDVDVDVEGPGGDSATVLLHYLNAANTVGVMVGTGSSYNHGVAQATQTLALLYGTKVIKTVDLTERRGRLIVESDGQRVAVSFNGATVLQHNFPEPVPVGRYAGFELYSYPNPFGERRGPLVSGYRQTAL
jgi:hypothetical protein